MEVVYSALLLHSAKLPITEDNIKKILQSIGLTPDENRIKALIASLEGVNIDEILKQAPAAITTAPSEEVKKEEEKKEEKKAEEAVAGLSSLFG